MTNSIELQVICKLLTTDDEYEIERLCSYDTSYYSVLTEQIEYILKHRDRTGKIPDLFTFQAKFEDLVIIQVNEPLSYLEEELKKNKQQILLVETFNKLADLGSGDILEAWSYLNAQCEKASELDSSKPLDIVKQADERAQKILEFNKQQRIPTGFKEIDEIMYGGLSTIEELLVIVARTNAGKAQPLWSKVLTPQGWTTMGDLNIGDVVIGENNDNGKVVQIFPQGEKDYYKIIFDDDTEVECCDEHLWKVLDESCRIRDNSQYGQHKILTTQDLRTSLDKKYSVDISDPIEFESTFDPTVELDGYLLGVILGDGGLRDGCVKITNENDEIWDRIEAIISKYSCKRSGKYKEYISGIIPRKNFVLQKIKEYGLLNIKSIDKFIPKKFLTAPISVRLDLLAGLVDTDGYISKDSKVAWEFDTSSEKLAYDFVELARSLGVKVKMHPRVDTYYTYKGIRKKGHGSRHITCRSIFNPFKLSKKAERYKFRKEPYKRSMIKRHCKMIKSIEYVGRTKCQCILLDNLTHTYITEGYTVTHNSWVCTKMLEAAHANGFTALYYSPEMQSAFIGTRFDTWKGHFKNSDLFRGRYSEEYNSYINELVNSDTGAYVVEDSNMSEGKTTVHSLENLVKRYHCQLLIIDGLSYISTSNRYSNESLKYKDICNDLFKLSKIYNCAVVVAVQANRETRENRDENGEPFPNIYTIAESDHPARIATQVFALRQLYEQHILELRLEKSRNARNEKPVLSYSIDFNLGSMEFVSSQSPNSNTTVEDFRTPIVSTSITSHLESEPVVDEESDDYDDIEF